MLKKILISTIIGTSCFAQANLSSIWGDLTRGNNSLGNYPKIINKLVDSGMYHTSVPYVKEFLVSGASADIKEIDSALEEVITHVGDRQFVLLPEKYLQKSKSPTLRYLLAKKLLRKRKLNLALKVLNASIPSNHSVKPFALMLEGTIFSYKKSYLSALQSFQGCVQSSESNLSKADSIQKKRQLLINKDYCLAGIARTHYAAKKYEEAESAYLDIDKKSYIWPELLVEEAWNSYYKGDYNRTLGKLVTYNAPVMKNIFNPEINVLRSMAYLKMCLYNDAINVVEDFYNTYEKPTIGLGKLVNDKSRDLKYYFLLVNSYKNGKRFSLDLLNDLLEVVMRDPAFLNLYESYVAGKGEVERIKTVSNKRLARVFNVNVRDSLVLQQKLIGSYVKRHLKISYAQLRKSFLGMSYIKLEVLARKKERLYSGFVDEGKRGDVKYLQRSEKQYFWTFNGEFWADELGDYVFALKSECLQ